MTIRFSVITITRNNRNGLKKTAKSIAEQTSKAFEWIIIDGNSTDGTKDDFGIYSNAHITSEPDRGIYDAMNKGIDKAKAEYLIFMNAGDTFANSETLQKVADKTGQKTYDLVYGDSLEETSYKRAKPYTTITLGMFTHHQAMFYNRKSLGDLRYDTHYKIAGDYDLTLRFLKEEKRSSLYLPIPVCIFESGGISQKNIALGRKEQFEARQKTGISLLKNVIITEKQKVASLIRSLCPSLYWILKRKA